MFLFHAVEFKLEIYAIFNLSHLKLNIFVFERRNVCEAQSAHFVLIAISLNSIIFFRRRMQ